ncbi:MAG: hypothetical protein C0485_08150 [Pirellula sp.]|nr:hypothetical protein [Pirellula sp.]
MHEPHSHSTRHFAAERAPSSAAQWARLEGKSATMAAELLEAGEATPLNHSEQTAAFCPHCVASAAVGAAIALILDRFVAGR